MKIKKIFIAISLLTLTAAFMVPLASSDLPHWPPYFWLVKITQTHPTNAILDFNVTFNCEPIVPWQYIPVMGTSYLLGPTTIHMECQYNWDPETGIGVVAGILVTEFIPNDIEMDIWIDWNYSDPDPEVYQHHEYARQYPVPTLGHEQDPHMPIPFHWEKDGLPFVPMTPPKLVTFDLEPYFEWWESAIPEQWHLYPTHGGHTTSCGHLGSGDAWHRHYSNPLIQGGVPFGSRLPWLTPYVGAENLTFSAPDPQTGIIYMTAPAAGFTDPLDHQYYSPRFGFYFWIKMLMPQDGYGWLFTGLGTDPVLGDVDILTYDIGSAPYFAGSDPSNGVCWQNATTNQASKWPDALAAYRGGFPDIGPDLVPGTSDDGFGDGTPDPAGSSVLYLPTKLLVLYDVTATGDWQPLFMAPFPMVLTTATAFDFVNEPTSAIHGCPINSVNDPNNQPPSPIAVNPHGGPITGQPWPGPWPKEAPKSISFVKYVCSWSILKIVTALGFLDTSYENAEWKIIENCPVITPAYPPGTQTGYQWMKGDGDLTNSPGKVDYNDLFGLADAYGSNDEKWVYGLLPGPPADPNYDARFDFDGTSKVDFNDLFQLADNYGNQVDP
jgi:hypothetical protein